MQSFSESKDGARAIQEDCIEDGQSMYASFSFLSGPESVTHMIAKHTAVFDYSVTAKFPVNTSFLTRLQEEVITVKLHRMTGHQQHVFAVGRIILRQVLHAFAKGLGVTHSFHILQGCRQSVPVL
jgi:hypothetical protein